MVATKPSPGKSAASRKERSSAARDHAPVRVRTLQSSGDHGEPPAAGAHAAHHLTNEDATPGAGALPSHAHRSGKEVDGGAG
jgi:hypothetical protein